MSEIVKQEFSGVRDFNAAHIFECGQCFRWSREEDGSYSGIVEGCFANVSYSHDSQGDSGTVTVWSNLFDDSPGLRGKFWSDYLDLGRDYGNVKRILTTEDPVMARAVQTGYGIRILNQSKWETLISFIISQNNNIPRIKGCIESLCRCFGKAIGTRHGQTMYAFPSVDILSVLHEEDLAPCRLGYRARYIVETARKIAYDGGALLESGSGIPTEKIREYLLSLPGVGPKVANCILLFSMGKSEVFPIDVWVRRVMSFFYGMGEHNAAAMMDYAERNFGEYGGIAQQYLFYYIRFLKDNDPLAYSKIGLGEPEAIEFEES